MKNSISSALERYLEFKKPSYFVDLFSSKEEFSQWCQEGSKEDLKATLKEFETAELYEYCSIIHKEIQQK